MNRRQFLLPLLGLLLAWPAQAQPGISPAQQRLLAAIEAPILVPGYLPDSCRLERVAADRGERSGVTSLGYTLSYECLGPDGWGSFELRGHSHQIVPAKGKTEITAVHPRYGKLRLMLFPAGEQQASPAFFSEPIVFEGSPLAYLIVSGGKNPGLPPEMLQRIVEGLTPQP